MLSRCLYNSSILSVLLIRPSSDSILFVTSLTYWGFHNESRSLFKRWNVLQKASIGTMHNPQRPPVLFAEHIHMALRPGLVILRSGCTPLEEKISVQREILHISHNTFHITKTRPTSHGIHTRSSREGVVNWLKLVM